MRTAIITGGNTGIGYASAKAMLASSEDWRVILACRDHGRAAAAVAQLGPRAESMLLDLDSLASVRAFATALGSRSIDAVVCNAGVQQGTTHAVTKDGFERTFGVNHLGHFLLVNLLLPRLAPSARVIVVASGTHDPAKKAGVPVPAWNDTAALAMGELGPASANDSPFARGQRRYSTSKLANIYFAYALARRLPPGMTANAFDPGLVPGTDLIRDAVAPLRFLAKHVMPHMLPLLRLFMGQNVHTADESGAALARLVTDSTLEGVTGRYFEGPVEIRSSDESYDRDRAEELWATSARLTA